MTKLLQSAQNLASETGILAKSYARVSKAKGEYFNIFSILNMETNEEQTHSKFIAELLNPRGRHGMVDRFLELFLEKFEIEDFRTELAKVDVEYHVGRVSDEHGGRIDILVRSGAKSIVIENKIYAGEQHNQLLRYHNAFGEKELFFLTLDGAESSQHNDLVRRKVNYRNISYEEDILDWLDACLKEAATVPVVRESIGQYMNLVKKLTGQNINQQMNQEIAKSILADDQRFEGFAALMGAAKEVRKTVLQEHLLPLLKDIAEEINKGESDEAKHLVVHVDEDYFMKYDNAWKSFNFRSQAASDNKINFLRFEFVVGKRRGYSNLMYGILLKSTELDSAEDKELREKLKAAYKEVFGEDSNNGHGGWALKAPFHEYSNWNNWQTLGSIRSEGFKRALKEKVEKLKEIVETI